MALPVTDGLVLDLRAAAISQADVTAVTAWPDSSGAGNNADILIGDAPVLRTTISGSGGPAVRFTNGALQFTNNAIFDTAYSAEIFIVVRTDGTTDNSGLYQFGGNDWTYYPYTDGNIYDGSFTDSRYSYTAVSPGSWHVYNVSHDALYRTTKVDGTVVHDIRASFTRPGSAPKNILRIGRAQGTPWHGDIAEVVAYNRALNNTERTQVLSYLTAQHVTAPATPPAADTTNHQWTNAILVRPDANGTWSSTLDSTGAQYATAEVNPTTYTLGGGHSGWYTFTPGADGTGVFHAAGTADCEVDVFSKVGSTWTLIAYNYGSSAPVTSAPITKDTQYYVRVVSGTSTGQNISLYFTGIVAVNKSVTAGPVTVATRLPTVRAPRPADRLAVPGSALTVALHAKIVGYVDSVDVPALGVDVQLPTGSLNDFTVPPITVGVTLPPVAATSTSVTLSSPAGGDTVATRRPQFVVGLRADDDTLVYTIEVQYADNADFTGATTLSMPAPVVDGGEILTPTADVPTHTYWRARLLLDGVEQLGWSDPQDFTTAADVTPVVLPITWSVATGAVRAPHLWHFDPPGGTTGDTVTVYGQGFGTSGTVLLGDTAVQVQSWTRVAATDDNGDDTARTIDGGDVTCEHDEIVITVPAVDGPGDALTVES
jgi:hypothetical protein